MVGITISNTVFWSLAGGCLLSIFLLLALFLTYKITPAGVFLKGFLRKRPVAWVKYRTGIGRFMLGIDADPGTMDVNGLGTVMLSENSYVRERSSGVAVFDVFSEYGATIPKEYGPIIEELKSLGFKVNCFADYQHLIKLSNDPLYAENYINSLPTKEREVIRAQVSKLKILKIEIKPYKTYKLHELAYMFPNNISPVYIEAKTINAVNRRMLKLNMDQKMWVYIGFGALLVVLSVIIAVKTLTSPEPKIIEVCKSGLTTGAQVISNITV